MSWQESFETRAHRMLIRIIESVRDRKVHAAVVVTQSDNRLVVAEFRPSMPLEREPPKGSRIARVAILSTVRSAAVHVWFLRGRILVNHRFHLPDDEPRLFDRLLDTVVSACACTLRPATRPSYTRTELDTLLATCGPHITNMCEEISFAESLWCHRFEATHWCLGLHPTVAEPDWAPSGRFRTLTVGRCHECMAHFEDKPERHQCISIPKWFGDASHPVAEIVSAYIAQHVNRGACAAEDVRRGIERAERAKQKKMRRALEGAFPALEGDRQRLAAQ